MVTKVGKVEKEGRSQMIATVERAADVLVLFSKTTSRDLGVTDIAEALGLSKAAVHRILASLRSRGFIDLNPESRRYRLGAASLTLGLAYLEGIDIRNIVAPELAALSHETMETATLSIRSGDQRIYVDQVRPEREIVMSVAIGVPYPLHSGGSSKALLAFLGEEEIDRYLGKELVALTPHTKTDVKELREDLAAIRKRGYSQSFGERQPGAASIAAPIFDHLGSPVAVISLCGPAERFKTELDTCIPLLTSAAQRISARLGYQPKS